MWSENPSESWLTWVQIQLTLATNNLYAASAFFVKLSLFLLYLRLFKPNKTARRLVYGGMTVCGLFYSASIISNCALCMPRPGQRSDTITWMLNFEKCGYPIEYLALCQGVFGTVSDVYLLVIPIQSIFQLHLPTKRKLGVSAIFMIGIMWVNWVVRVMVFSLIMLLPAALSHALLAVSHTAPRSSL